MNLLDDLPLGYFSLGTARFFDGQRIISGLITKLSMYFDLETN